MNQELMNMIEEVEGTLSQLKEDAVKFTEKGNNAAGTRVRTGSMSIIKTLKEVRKTVSEIKNS